MQPMAEGRARRSPALACDLGPFDAGRKPAVRFKGYSADDRSKYLGVFDGNVPEYIPPKVARNTSRSSGICRVRTS